MHGINQLNKSLSFHSMLIDFSYAHYPLQTIKKSYELNNKANIKKEKQNQ